MFCEIGRIKLLVLIIKPFYIFWQNISFGLERMEYRATATLCVGLYINLITLFNYFLDDQLPMRQNLNFLLIASLVIFYFWFPIYLRKYKDESLKQLDDINTKDRIYSVVFVICYFLLSAILMDYLG